MKTFTEAVDTFLESADWLTDDDLPATVSLQQTAKALDKRMSAGMLNVYGLTYRNLMKRRGSRAEIDEDEDFLNSLEQG